MEVTPAIVRSFGKEDRHSKIISEPYNGVTHSRGFGDSGYRIQVVEHKCPACSFDRMVRRVDVSPERQNEVRYFCLNPNCGHFVKDQLSYATYGNYPQHDVNEPEIFEV